MENPQVIKPNKKANHKIDSRAISTFLRNSYRTHTSLSSLADRKANIMMKFNSIVISIVIVFFQSILEFNPAAMVSGIVFLVTALASLAFATLSARPHVTKLNKGRVDWQIAKENLFFFGNFTDLSLPDYEKAFDAMIQESPTIYGNMARDLYHLGKVLDLKFKYLKWSYDIFLIGLFITVMAFLISFFFIASVQ